MVAAHPLPDDAAMQAWIEQQIAELTPEERAQYDTSEVFRGMVHVALEHEWNNPGPSALEREADEKYGGDRPRALAEGFVAFALQGCSAADVARVDAQRAELYGDDAEREVVAIQDGTHPAQRLRC